MDTLTGLLIAVGFFIILRIISNRLFTQKRCAWCKSLKIKFISGEVGHWHWQYRNKDGSRDKRVKSNYEQAGYTSNYECKKCGAKTMFKHFTSKKPSKKVKIWLRELISEGSIERVGKNWESKSGVRYSTNSENRKNN